MIAMFTTVKSDMINNSGNLHELPKSITFSKYFDNTEKLFNIK